ncbi:hypothetical protein EDF67_10165 [Sphingobacterium sp. JUb78]|nr:hypothetical protein EDF67_10165 [Sphingobacterium sp. JUb78]
MVQHYFKTLPDKRIKAILRKIHLQVPHLMKILAPKGWKESKYHQQILNFQQQAYREYLTALFAEKNENNYINKQNMDQFTFLNEYAISLEEYHYFQYPGIYQDKEEAFYLLFLLLYDICTEGFLLYQHQNTTDIMHYYLPYTDVEEIVLKIAGEQSPISEEDIQFFFLNDIPIDWDDMDRFNCLQLVFEILQEEQYVWHHIDAELMHIAICYQEHSYIEHSALSIYEKSLQKHQITKTIQKYLKSYQHTFVDPFDFAGIISLYNRQKINYAVLAYVHCYQAFPVGYPYQVYHYQND